MEHIDISLQRSLLFTEFLSCFRYADYISIMSFDYHTATSDNVTGLNSPLRALPGENRNDTKLNVVSAFHQSTFLTFLFINNHSVRLRKQMSHPFLQY
jgi:GH18 family chitinase